MTNYQRYNSQNTDYGGYRYFFNGQESDAEAYGQGGLASYEFRQYDTRLGRWWGVDPLFAYNHSFSPYIFTNNNPILLIDFKVEILLILEQVNLFLLILHMPLFLLILICQRMFLKTLMLI